MEQPNPTKDSEEIKTDYSAIEDNIKYYYNLKNELTICDAQYLNERVRTWNKKLTKLLTE